MTRDNLIQFLQDNYEPDEQLVWQTISYENVENGHDKATPEKWAEFIEYLSNYNYIAEEFSEQTFNGFHDYLENN